MDGWKLDGISITLANNGISNIQKKIFTINIYKSHTHCLKYFAIFSNLLAQKRKHSTCITCKISKNTSLLDKETFAHQAVPILEQNSWYNVSAQILNRKWISVSKYLHQLRLDTIKKVCGVPQGSTSRSYDPSVSKYLLYMLINFEVQSK